VRGFITPDFMAPTYTGSPKGSYQLVYLREKPIGSSSVSGLIAYAWWLWHPTRPKDSGRLKQQGSHPYYG